MPNTLYMKHMLLYINEDIFDIHRLFKSDSKSIDYEISSGVKQISYTFLKGTSLPVISEQTQKALGVNHGVWGDGWG